MLIINKVISTILILIAAWYLIDFPYHPVLLGIGLIIYFIASQIFHHCWLIVVPVLLPMLYLAPFSGRLFFDEFDLLIIVTIAGYLWKGKKAPKSSMAIGNGGKILLFFFCIVYAIAVIRGLLPFSEINKNSFASYYSNLNSLRIGKGFFWAICLLPIWNYSEVSIPDKIQQFFTGGVALGSIGVFLAVLWERGFIHDIFYAEDSSQLLSNLLNFHTDYRATGLFAEMHTGDTATDGYLILALPLTAYFLFLQKNKTQFSIGLISLLGTIYSIFVTFSRGLYLGMGVIALIGPLMALVTHRKKLNSATVGISILFGPVIVYLSFIVFKNGGLLSLIGGLILFLSGIMLTDLVKNYSRLIFFPISGLIALVSIYCLKYGMLSSKWNEIDFSATLQLTALSTVVFTAIGVIYNKIWGGHSSFRQRSFIASLSCVLIILTIPSLFGSRMNARFETVNADFRGRIAHWQNAINIMDDDLMTTLFGQGIGTFPITYYWVTQQAKDVGGYSFIQKNQNTYVAFAGSSDVKLSQRIGLSPNNLYKLSVDVRTLDPEAMLQIRICHRQLINPTEWNPTCWLINEKIKNNNGQWQSLNYNVPSKNLGSLKSYLQAPLVITFENRREYEFNLKKQTLLDIDNLSIKSPEEEELIKNGDFEKGIDHWYAYYDFNHLPWHIKNLWVSVYFDSGIIGLVMFVLLIGYSLTNMFKQYLDKKYFSFACLLGVIGFLCVGCFGTMIDGPRISFLFYFIILINLASHTKKFKKNHRISIKAS
jgi:hypothetical protein